MTDIDISEWTCVWTISLVVFVVLVRAYAKWKNL